MEGIDLCGVNLKEIDLHEFNLAGANLSGADIRGADLRNANLSRVKLNEAKLNRANLMGASLRDIDLRNMDLTETEMGRNDLAGARLEGVDLSNLPNQGALLELPYWHRISSDLYFYLTSDVAIGSLLTTMDSVDERHADVKLRMARELITKLQRVDVSSVALLLLNTLYKAPYLSDAMICNWLEKICDQYLGQYDKRVLPPLTRTTENGLQACLEYSVINQTGCLPITLRLIS